MRTLDLDGTLVREPPSPTRADWFALFGAPAAWAVQGIVAWWIERTACWTPAADAGAVPAGLRAAEVGVAVVAGVVAVAALLTAWSRLRGQGPPAAARSRPAFLAIASVLVAVAFLIGILLTAYAVAMLDLCQALR